MKDVIVDHHPIAAGSILSIEDIGQFANNLYCETDNLRILCKTDHDIWTLADAQKLSWEEATVLKNVIAFEKSHNIKQIVDYCKKHGYNSCTNSDKRRKALTDIFNEQYKEK